MPFLGKFFYGHENSGKNLDLTLEKMSSSMSSHWAKKGKKYSHKFVWMWLHY